MKILIIALSGIGDALMFSPSVRLLRSAFPDAQIDFLLMFKGAKEIYQYNPHISNLIHFDFLKHGLIKSLKFIYSIRNQYDITFNVYPSNRKEYNIISFLINAKKRFAVKYKRMNFINLGWLNNFLVIENDHTHNVVTNVKMIELFLNKNISNIPALEIYFSDKENQFAKDFFLTNIINSNDFIIGIHPGCATLKNHIKRRWEPDKFVHLSKKLLSEFNCKIFLFGGPEESKLKSYIYSAINSSNVYIIDTNTLLQSAAIMSRCNLFITNDSALMHIAAALKLNIASIIGPTNINYIHPWKTNFRTISLNLECSPCFFYSPKPLTCFRNDVKFKCIKNLTVDFAFEIIKSFLLELKQ